MALLLVTRSPCTFACFARQRWHLSSYFSSRFLTSLKQHRRLMFCSCILRNSRSGDFQPLTKSSNGIIPLFWTFASTSFKVNFQHIFRIHVNIFGKCFAPKTCFGPGKLSRGPQFENHRLYTLRQRMQLYSLFHSPIIINRSGISHIGNDIALRNHV